MVTNHNTINHLSQRKGQFVSKSKEVERWESYLLVITLWLFVQDWGMGRVVINKLKAEIYVWKYRISAAKKGRIEMDSTTENGNLATDFELSEGIDDGNELLHFKSSMRSSDGIMKFQPIWRRIRRG